MLGAHRVGGQFPHRTSLYRPRLRLLDFRPAHLPISPVLLAGGRLRGTYPRILVEALDGDQFTDDFLEGLSEHVPEIAGSSDACTEYFQLCDSLLHLHEAVLCAPPTDGITG
jgi:hypothetical protein